MSRIEKALEKAVKMRETPKAILPAEVMPVEAPPAWRGIEAAGDIIDPALVDGHIVSLTDPHSTAAEQYKKLRARILRATRKDILNTIMVTSSDIGEGKSMTAINLAVTLSNEIDHTVLLVDTDLRNPSLHKYLGIEPKIGLSDYLKGGINLPDVLIRTGIGKLVILPGGNPDPNAAELLSSDRMKMLVREMKLRYKDRYVIFDSSPLLVIADALSLGNYMDGILFVIQEGRTSQKTAMQALSLMEGWNILGIVFNNVPQYLSKGTYPYYYRYDQQGRQQKSDGNGGDDARRL